MDILFAAVLKAGKELAVIPFSLKEQAAARERLKELVGTHNYTFVGTMGYANGEAFVVGAETPDGYSDMVRAVPAFARVVCKKLKAARLHSLCKLPDIRN